jgi:hypothetical protein
VRDTLTHHKIFVTQYKFYYPKNVGCIYLVLCAHILKRSYLVTNIGGRSSQTQLFQLRYLFALNGKLHVSALIGHRQVFSQINLGSKNMYVMRVYLV